MDLYEYQGKELFRRFGIPVSDGRLATTPEEARSAAEELGGQVVVKAQVLAGGRGKAGGIKLADGPDEAAAHAEAILGMDIRGHVVRLVWIEQASDIATEYYLSVTFDRGEKKPLFMFTTQGGVDIEEVAATSPEALGRVIGRVGRPPLPDPTIAVPTRLPRSMMEALDELLATRREQDPALTRQDLMRGSGAGMPPSR